MQMWKLDCKRMYVTYFGGDEYSGPDTDFMDVVLSFVPESNVSATTSKVLSFALLLHGCICTLPTRFTYNLMVLQLTGKFLEC